jgi:hypothetical protein
MKRKGKLHKMVRRKIRQQLKHTDEIEDIVKNNGSPEEIRITERSR